MEKNKLIKYLDNFLLLDKFNDTSKNWLQVDTTKNEIKKIWYAVDATSYIFDLAIENKVDLIIVHHWLFWWIENVIKWVYFDRISKLLNNNIWLYACHLPLDAHPLVWNNIWIATSLINIIWNLGKKYKPEDFLNIIWKEKVNNESILKILLSDWIVYKDNNIILEKFWNEKWVYIWYGIKFKNIEIPRVSIIDPFCKMIWFENKLYNFWKKNTFKSIAICSGWALDLAQEAKEKNYDLLIVWEWAHHQLIYTKELKQSILLAWHYETEKFWPKLLAYHLKEKFWVDIIFLDEKY